MLLFRLAFTYLAFLGAIVAAGLLCQYLGGWALLVLAVLLGLVFIGTVKDVHKDT